MSENVTLIKDNPLLPAEDYIAMRKQGFESIEKLGHEIWTDYNNSDPGITILEAVAYAITDLAYRTGFEVKDLLAPEKLTQDTWKQIFYTARQILHNSPLTINDYRKMIVDTKGVRNAWIEPSKEYEVPMWIDYNYFEKRKDEDCGCKDNLPKTCFGRVGLDAVTKQTVDKFKEDKKKETQKAIDKITEKKNQLDIDQIAILTKLNLEKEPDPYRTLQLTAELNDLKRKYKIILAKIADLKNTLQIINDMPAIIIPPKIIEMEGLYNVMIEYEENVLADDQREEVRQQVVQKLSHHRNLCEDFLTVNAVEYLDFGVVASIVLEEYADPDTVLAEVFFTIYKYFTPSIPFHTIDQMLEKKYDIDEIFEGPALRHGFIETSAIEKTDLFRDIRLSDIINEVTDIKGIKAITYLQLPFTSFDDTGGNAYFNEWIKYLQEERKLARIVPENSKVIFCKQMDIISYFTGSTTDKRPDRMLKFFKDLKTAERKYRLENIPLDLQVPVGQNMELEDYYPVTYSLPMCYGVSEKAGLPNDADDNRKVQALQLKGYLLFFEHLLANHLVQLNHLRDIYTMDDSVTKTYYTRALTEIIGIKEDLGLKELLIDHNNHGKNHFDQILKEFTDVLQNLVEPPELFAERRNRFLNSFLARFNEDMSEYEAINRWLVPHNVEKRLIHDKINILKNGEYYKISTNRGKGYDYTSPEFWDTSNVSGTERRVSRLLGFSNARRHTLAPDFIFSEPVMEVDAKKVLKPKLNIKKQPLNVIKIVNPHDNTQVLFTSVEVTDGCCIEVLMNEIITHADNRRNYIIHDELNQYARKTAGKKGEFWFELFDGLPNRENAVSLGAGLHFDKKEDRDKAFRELQEVIKKINGNEGLHLIEHILLRPKFDEVLNEADKSVAVSFLNICLDKCDLGIGLGEGTQAPLYRKKISRLPANKCFDKMPWILQYMRRNKTPGKPDQSILFQYASEDNSELTLLKFGRYTSMVKRIRDLQEYGSERINYTILPKDVAEPIGIKFSFIITGDKKEILAQSPYMFNKGKDGKPTAEEDIEEEIKHLMEWFGSEMDWYCEPDPCDNDEDTYSFRATAVLPCWPERLRDVTFRNLVEKTIYAQSPAHTHIKVVWLGIPEMKRFEKVYKAWLEEMAQTEIPMYEKVNPLVDTLNTVKPCGVCEDDCKEKSVEVVVG